MSTVALSNRHLVLLAPSSGLVAPFVGNLLHRVCSLVIILMDELRVAIEVVVDHGL